MKIFIFTTYFAPSIGGVERLAELLATQFVELGHEVIVATLTPGHETGPWSFPVVRRPSSQRFFSLLQWCDVHLQANLSLKYLHPLAVRKPFVVTVQTDYASDIGKRRARDYLKLAFTRYLHGVACSPYIAQRIRCETIIGNPYDNATFTMAVPLEHREKEIVFLGRLVSVKGCDTLLAALANLKERDLSPSCTVIGDGPERDRLTEMAYSAGLGQAVRFVGALHGAAVAAELNRHRIMVVPSRYHEPFGIVALEGLACGCLPIVSAGGGLVDAIGQHGLTFDNGNALQLAQRIELALDDDNLIRRKLAGADRHLANFTARRVAQKYLAFFEQVLPRPM